MNNEDIDKMIQHLESLRSGEKKSSKERTRNDETIDIVEALRGVGFDVVSFGYGSGGTRTLEIYHVRGS